VTRQPAEAVAVVAMEAVKMHHLLGAQLEPRLALRRSSFTLFGITCGVVY
jgi:hypothetical protein